MMKFLILMFIIIDYSISSTCDELKKYSTVGVSDEGFAPFELCIKPANLNPMDCIFKIGNEIKECFIIRNYREEEGKKNNLHVLNYENASAIPVSFVNSMIRSVDISNLLRLSYKDSLFCSGDIQLVSKNGVRNFELSGIDYCIDASGNIMVSCSTRDIQKCKETKDLHLSFLNDRNDKIQKKIFDLIEEMRRKDRFSRNDNDRNPNAKDIGKNVSSAHEIRVISN